MHSFFCAFRQKILLLLPQNREDVSCPKSFPYQKSNQSLPLFFVAVFRIIVLFLKLPADQKLLIRSLQLFVYLPDQFRRHAFAKLKLLLQLTSALLILPIFDIIAHIALIIQITIAFYISNGLLHQLRLKLRLQKLLPKLGLRPVHPLQKVQRLNLRFLQPGLRLLPVLLLLLSALLSLVIHNAP